MPGTPTRWRKRWRFYEFIAGGGCRFMCSWDTRPESVDAFAADIRAACAAVAG
jgi:threonine aldolase